MIFNGIAVQTDNQKCLIFTGGNTDPPDQCQFTVRLPDDCRVSLQGSPCTPVISRGFAPICVQDKILLIMNMRRNFKVLDCWYKSECGGKTGRISQIYKSGYYPSCCKARPIFTCVLGRKKRNCLNTGTEKSQGVFLKKKKQQKEPRIIPVPKKDEAFCFFYRG